MPLKPLKTPGYYPSEIHFIKMTLNEILAHRLKFIKFDGILTFQFNDGTISPPEGTYFNVIEERWEGSLVPEDYKMEKVQFHGLNDIYGTCLTGISCMSESGAIISAGTTSKDYDEYEYDDNEVREWSEDEDTEDYHKDRKEKLKDAGVN
jgi:hypothetical protein